MGTPESEVEVVVAKLVLESLLVIVSMGDDQRMVEFDTEIPDFPLKERAHGQTG
jgi:hypothetical protein